MTDPEPQIAGEERFTRAAAASIRAAIKLAAGNEVCFVCALDEHGMLVNARVVARGDVGQVLALPGVAQRGEMLVHNHPSGYLVPSAADLEIAARMHTNGVGFAITNNEASHVYVVTEVPEVRPVVAITSGDVSEILGPSGAIARAMRARSGDVQFGYEDRPSQRAMAGMVTDAFNSGHVALIEAGTGVGKSMGYLVPALRWAAANDERTIVSTATITLQEQLVGKDLPFLASALDDQPVRFALLKGWRNYLCLNRLEMAQGASASLFDDGGTRDLQQIAQWAQKTVDGSLADLTVQPKVEVWDEVAAEPDLCGRLSCAHYDNCFVFKARREAAMADVVVVNHHLLLADLAVRRSSQNWDDAAVLPSYKRVVIDEGHHLEDAASSHLGVSVTRRGLLRLFARLERRGNRGLLPVLAGKLAERSDLLSTASLDLVRDKVTPSVHAARELVQQLFGRLQALLEHTTNGAAFRLDGTFDQHVVWSEGLDSVYADLLREIAAIGDGLRLVRERIEADEERAKELSGPLSELRGVSRRLLSTSDALVHVLRPAPGGGESVRWIECVGRPAPERNVALYSVPLDLAPILKSDLFDRVDTAVITSATLATDGGFDFLKQRLGLAGEQQRVRASAFSSPFRYEEQALLVVPTDMPAPNEDPAGHAAAVQRQLRDLATASDGGVFALFTSHRDVRAAAAWWREQGLDGIWPLLVHGEDEPRDVLLGRFRDSGKAVLMGTASFWEGVDVPGEALRALLLAKLPFRVPSEPVVAAQCEAIESRGGNSFAEFMLPHASLRLKQGFGRLIRTAQDRGVVVISDPRLVTKRYGRGLLEALPPARRVIARWGEAHGEITNFWR